MLRAATMLELKVKLREAMGWPPRRSWTAKERDEVGRLYTFRPDFKSGEFVAVRTG